jgi:hypothetical protein
VVELTHPGSNPTFDMGVTFTTNYFFSGMRRPDRQRDVFDDRLHESQDKTSSVFRMCVHVFIWVIANTCMNICVYTIFLKKLLTPSGY